MSEKKRKSVLLAGLLGLIFPGLGLFYAAPWVMALVATIVTLVAWKLLAWIPIIGPVIMGLLAIGSAVLGMLAARAYNQLGSRPPMKRLPAGRS